MTITGFNMLRNWSFPEGTPRLDPSFESELHLLMNHLPEDIRVFLLQKYGSHLMHLSEIYMQMGQPCEAVFQTDHGETRRVDMGVGPCTRDMIHLFADMFSTANTVGKRRGISGTLHRISLITHPNNSVIGVNIRVGRSFEGTLNRMIGPRGLYDLGISSDTNNTSELSSLLIIGRPGSGKTTVLREIAATLAADPRKIVVVIDKTNEIAGDGETPHGCIGLARWMPVGNPANQHKIMIEAVENQNPHVLIVDEISNSAEVAAAKSIAQRGVTLIATVHGKYLPELVSCGERRTLVGDISSVTLSGQQAERRPDKRKQVEMRKHEPVFKAALEMHSRTEWIVHTNVEECIDAFLDKKSISCQKLTPGVATSMVATPVDGKFEYAEGTICVFGNKDHASMTGGERTTGGTKKGKRRGNNKGTTGGYHHTI